MFRAKLKHRWALRASAQEPLPNGWELSQKLTKRKIKVLALQASDIYIVVVNDRWTDIFLNIEIAKPIY